MIIRTVDLDRARAAAVSELAHVEHLVTPPTVAAPTAPTSSNLAELAGRDQLTKSTKLVLWGLSHKAAQRWGEHWLIDEAEADAITAPLLDVVELECGPLSTDPYKRLYFALAMFAVPRVLGSILGAAKNDAPTAPTSVDVKSETAPIDLDAKEQRN